MLNGSGALEHRWKVPASSGLATFDRLDCRAPQWRFVIRMGPERFRGGNIRARFLLALFRVGTYIDQAERLSAGVAIDQLKLALKGNVWYVDGGWQTLVDGLRCRASDAGATIRTGARVTSVCGTEDGVIVGLANGEFVRSRTAVVAVTPRAAVEVLGFTARLLPPGG